MGLSFTIAAGLRQRSHFQVRALRDSWPHFTVSVLRLPQPGGPGPRIYIPQEHSGPGILPDTRFSFCRLLRFVGLTRDSVCSESESCVCSVKVKVRVTLPLVVYRWSVRLGVKSLGLKTREFFFQLNLCDNSPYVTSSLTRRWVCLLWICLAFRQVYVSNIYHVLFWPPLIASGEPNRDHSLQGLQHCLFVFKEFVTMDMLLAQIPCSGNMIIETFVTKQRKFYSWLC
jgi:hypothetical protein